MEQIKRATGADWSAMFGTSEPADWIGLVAASPHLIFGIGGVYRANDGRYWMFFHRVAGIRKTKTAHTAARIIVDMMHEAGEPAYALADPRYSGACLWLRRLGFIETTEAIEGHTVWTLLPQQQ